MYQFIMLIHVFAALCIIALVLVQQGKGATAGAAFGSGASSTVFGARGSGSFLFRVTVGFVAVFFMTSIALNFLASQKAKQERVVVLPSAPVTQPSMPVQAAPAAPAVESAAKQEEKPATVKDVKEKKVK